MSSVIFSSRRRHTRCSRDWSSDVCSSDLVEKRLRNWVYDRVLSGDIIVEQNIHVIDICNWVLKNHPLKASATGGRLCRPANDGDVYGNYNVIFHYPEIGRAHV